MAKAGVERAVVAQILSISAALAPAGAAAAGAAAAAAVAQTGQSADLITKLAQDYQQAISEGACR
jgi:hypothetical protein